MGYSISKTIKTKNLESARCSCKRTHVFFRLQIYRWFHYKDCRSNCCSDRQSQSADDPR